MHIMISGEALNTMQRDAVDAYPYECCGFMYGPGDEPRDITLAKPAKNTREENRERRFEIDAKDYMAAEKFADNNQLLLLGVYHSHPDHPAIPSEYDLRQALPFFSYTILSVRKGRLHDLKSWRLNDERRFEEEILKEQDILKELFNQ